MIKFLRWVLSSLLIEFFDFLRCLFALFRMPIDSLLLGPGSRFCILIAASLLLVTSLYTQNVGGTQGIVRTVLGQSVAKSEAEIEKNEDTDGAPANDNIESENPEIKVELSDPEMIYLVAIAFTLLASLLNVLGGLYSHWVIRRLPILKPGLITIAIWGIIFVAALSTFQNLRTNTDGSSSQWAFIGMLLTLTAIVISLIGSCRERFDLLRLERDLLSGCRVLSDSLHELEIAELEEQEEAHRKKSAELLQRQSTQADAMGK